MDGFGIYILIALILFGVFAIERYALKTKPENKRQAELIEAAHQSMFSKTLKLYENGAAAIVIKQPRIRVELTKYSSSVKLLKGMMTCWVDENQLCFFPDPPREDNFENYSNDIVFLFKIPFEKIEYFSQSGEVFHETKITGGGGGGSSVAGAVAGAVIAGGVGAVIGSRNKNGTIQSELVTHDTRETSLNYFDNDNQRRSIYFTYSGYQLLNDLIPEKEFNIVSSIKNALLIKKNSNPSFNIPDQIRELSKLKEEGLITEEEYSKKRSALIEKL
jgi:hypothetical protein